MKNICKQVAWTIIVTWLSFNGLIAIATAQVQPPRRKHRMLISKQKPKKEKTDATVGVGESLIDIAHRASRQKQSQMVDLVFVIDGSRQMRSPIMAIEKRLVDMTGIFEAALIDYRFAGIWFRKVKGVPQTTVQPFSNNFSIIQEDIHKLRISPSDVSPGYGLDTIAQGLGELNFRSEAVKHFVVVSNSALQTNWDMEGARKQIVKDIIDQCKLDEIHLNIIGVGERIQAELANETDGKWYAIDANQRQIDQDLDIDKSILKIEGIFKRIAQQIAKTAKPAADIVFVFDSSLSMANKVDRICTGVDKMSTILDTEGLDYRFGVIRFRAAAGGGESVVVLTKPPLSASQVQGLFRIPKRGDEHLLDAVIEGVPKLKTPADRQLVLVIVTDESTSNRREKGYTSARAIAICREARAQVHVIGGVTSMSVGSLSDAFQRQVAQITKGTHYIMPGSVIADESR